MKQESPGTCFRVEKMKWAVNEKKFVVGKNIRADFFIMRKIKVTFKKGF